MDERDDPEPKPIPKQPPLPRGGLGHGHILPAALGFLVFFVLSGLVGLLRGNSGSSTPVEQPIAFNHKKHVEENGLTCDACHTFYEKEAFSGLPGAEDCSFCHLEAQGTSQEEAKLVRLLADGGGLDWQPLFRQPAHVYYSHRRHVAAGIECSVCHGSIGESETPPTRVSVLSMDECIGCHEPAGVPVACTTCHR